MIAAVRRGGHGLAAVWVAPLEELEHADGAAYMENGEVVALRATGAICASTFARNRSVTSFDDDFLLVLKEQTSRRLSISVSHIPARANRTPRRTCPGRRTRPRTRPIRRTPSSSSSKASSRTPCDKSSYRRLALKYHPDKNAATPRSLSASRWRIRF